MSGTERTEDFGELLTRVDRLLASPSDEAIGHSRRRLDRWFQETADTIWWGKLASPVGVLHLAAGADGLQRVSFAQNSESFLRSFDRRTRLVEEGAQLAEYRRQLSDYFAGRRRRFSLALDLRRVTPFQRQVLTATGAIPPGQVRTYGQIARQLGKPGAARAVGQALGRNPLPIVLPCHRVVASDGSLGGYTGGLQHKLELLQLEGARQG